MKKLLTIAFSLFFIPAAFAQETQAAQKGFLDDPFNSPMLPLYTVLTLIFVVTILVALTAWYTVKVLNVLTTQVEKERAAKLGIAYKPQPTVWEKLIQTANASVPLEEEKNIELHHSYDGIKELDNHLPPWWKWLFYGTIGWSAVYLVVYHISKDMPLQIDEYQNEVALAEEQARKLKASQPQASIDESTLVYSHDAAIIEKGKSVFMSNNCGACHRNDGGGNSIGPNLTDEYWLHGGDVKSVFTTVKNGVVEKGMPAWGKAMSPQDVRDVTFFIMSLQGTKPENAKAPQGEIFKSTTVAADTTKAQASL